MAKIYEYNLYEFPKVPIVRDDKNKRVYINAPCSFDIETTSYRNENGEKCVTMYIWQFAIFYEACYGRTWLDFKIFLSKLEQHYHLGKSKKIIVYVHNLGYETGFLQGEFKIRNSFATQPHKPMYIEIGNIIFKDSLILSGLSLRRTLEECNCPKEYMKTTLDYNKKRHSETPLTDDELKYCCNDVLGLNFFIAKEIEKNGGNILNIPLTKTGYARRYVRNHCFAVSGYKQFIDDIQIDDMDLFIQLSNAYCGAYNHANPTKIGIVQHNVSSIDFTSSYPSVMIRHAKYPISKFTPMKITHFDVLKQMCENFACVFTIRFENIYAKSMLHTISAHKCLTEGEFIVDNGRIVTADYITTTITNIDFLDILDLYNFDKSKIKVTGFYYAEQGYLPKPFIECILKLYGDKTTLKGVEGKEDVYIVSKGILNALYGMCCTSPIQPNYKLLNGEWVKNEKPPKKALYSNATNKNTFLVFSWGVWITALARHELYDGIKETLKGDLNNWIYSDTDSIKFTDGNIYNQYIETYNKRCIEELEKCMDYYNIDKTKINPDGLHPLGVWDFEGVKYEFKTLGCKRYCYTENPFYIRENNIGNWCRNDKHYHRVLSLLDYGKFKFVCTVSGLDKKQGAGYIYNHGCFEFFNDEMEIPSTHSGRLTHTYITDMKPTKLTDYLGNKYICTDKTGVHLEGGDYHINFAKEFLNYIKYGKNNVVGEKIDNMLIELIGEV